MIGGLIAGAIGGFGQAIGEVADQRIAAEQKLAHENQMTEILKARDTAMQELRLQMEQRSKEMDVARRSKAFDQADAAAIAGRDVGPTTDQQEFDTRRGILERRLPPSEVADWSKANDPMGRQKALVEMQKLQQDIATNKAQEGYLGAHAKQVGEENQTRRDIADITSRTRLSAAQTRIKPEDVAKEVKQAMDMSTYDKTIDPDGYNVARDLVTNHIQSGVPPADALTRTNEIVKQGRELIRLNPDQKMSLEQAVTKVAEMKLAAGKPATGAPAASPPASKGAASPESKGAALPPAAVPDERKLVSIEKAPPGLFGGRQFVATYSDGTKAMLSGDEAERQYILHGKR